MSSGDAAAQLLRVTADDPEYRRQGIGRRLLAYALRQMMQDWARSSFLEVRAINLPAQEMYRKFGYEATGRRRHYYLDNDEDAIIMFLDDLATRMPYPDGSVPSALACQSGSHIGVLNRTIRHSGTCVCRR